MVTLLPMARYNLSASHRIPFAYMESGVDRGLWNWGAVQSVAGLFIFPDQNTLKTLISGRSGDHEEESVGSGLLRRDG